MRRRGSYLLALCCALLITFGAGALSAQQTAAPIDYAAWDALADRAEEAIGRDAISDTALLSFRERLAAERDRFLGAQNINQTRIETLRSQIDALGPAPGEGETEAADIAERRQALDARLAELEAPGRRAVEAYNRADGLISEIDATIRARQADTLFRLGPSPLNPANWPDAAAATADTISGIGNEIARNWASAAQRKQARDNLPATLFFLVLAAGLLLRGGSLMERLTYYFQNREGDLSRAAVIFAVSLGQIVVPVLGILALVAAVNSVGLLGLRGEAMVNALSVLGVAVIGARWLATRVFPRAAHAPTPLRLGDERRAEGRLYATGFGALVGLAVILNAASGFDEHSDISLAVLVFPVVLVSALVLFRVGQLLIAAAMASDTGAEDFSVVRRLTRTLGQAAIAIAVISPVLAAIGYVNLANAMVFPAVLTLAVLAAIGVLHFVFRDLFAMLTGKTPDEAKEALVPVLISLALAVAALPLLALIWGARATDLAELWTRFREGFAIGDARISPTDFVTFAVVFAIGYVLTRMLQGTLRTTVLPKTSMDTGGRNAVISGVGYIGIFLAAVVAITSAGIDLSSLAIVAGALSVGIGFGLQNIVSNFVSGIILLIERPISEGDWIEVGGQMGYVRAISVRSTRIETFDRTDVIVPNADLVSGAVTNWTRGNLVGRVIVPVGVAYGTDTRRVETILREIAEAHPMVTMNPPPSIMFMGFGADSLDFEIRAILRDVNWVLSVKSDMNHEIARRFAEEQIEIPFAQRDIWLRNPETLQARPAGPAGSEPPRSDPDPAGASRPASPDIDGSDE